MGVIKKPEMEQEWQKHEPKMNSNLITLKVLINKVLFKLTLINTSCEYYLIVDKDLTTELRLPPVEIPLKPITGFIQENTKEPRVEITKIAKFPINIQGYRLNIFIYIMPMLLNLIIIELP